MMTDVPESITPPDQDLVAAHRAGDPLAFRRIVERYQGMVCALAYSACGNLAQSEDIAQEVFVAAWKQLGQLREPDKLGGWLAGITRRQAQNALRRVHRTPVVRAEALPPEIPAAGADPRARAIASDEAALMWNALAGLPEIYRDALVLYYREERSIGAVARALEISEDAAKQRLARGRALLTERMARIVEESLERSVPAPAFAVSVLLLLPGPLHPVLLESVEGATAAGRTLATAGALGSALGKGGALIKVLSAVAFLPALLQGAQDFIRFNNRSAAQGDEATRRQAAWAYLTMNGGIGLFFFGVAGFRTLFPQIANGWVMALVVLCAVSALLLVVRAKKQMNRLLPAADSSTARGFERRSARTLLGWPLYHVRLGTRSGVRAPAVRAWVAISDGWAIGGLFAFGPLAVAPAAMGLVSAGLLTIGVAAIGGGVLGLVAVGWLSRGFVAIAGAAAKGTIVMAPLMASPVLTAGGGPAADTVARFFQDHWFFRFTGLVIQSLVWAGMLGWVMPMVLTATQLWRTRQRA